MFKSLSHFEFIFVYGERVCSNFIYMRLSNFPVPLAEETVIFPLYQYILASFVED